jgi:MAF protein
LFVLKTVFSREKIWQSMSDHRPEIVLASGSKYRAMLLERLRISFRIQTPGISEIPDANETPMHWAERLAARKAQAVCMANPDALVIGSDQIAEFQGRIIGKPSSEQDAVDQLLAFSGHSVAFHTGIALIGMASGFSSSGVETVCVHFRELTREEVEHYVKIEQPLDCAGSFKCESLGITLFNRIDARDPTALIGLPLIRLCHMLRQAGVALPLDAE